MAQSSSSLGLPGFNLRGIFFAIVVIALVGALFFIPEIIDFQRSMSGTRTTAGAPDDSARASTSLFSKNSESPLAKLRNLIDGGLTERTRMKKVVERGDRATGFDTQSPAPVRWDDIRSKDSRKQLQQAENEVSELAKALPVDRTASRYALVTLGNGLRDVALGDADKALAPDEAIRYLEYLHAAVSRSLIQENVDRILFERWQRVSFGSTLAEYSRQLDRQFVPFNPQLTLMQVEVTQRARKNRLEEQSPLFVSASGYVVGSDISQIEIWGAGSQQRIVKVKKPDPQGLSRFNTGKIEAKGLITMRVVGKNGQRFEKSYQFFPRVRVFTYRKGKYFIPAATSDGDTSVDRFFTHGVRGVGEGAGGFFGGSMISTF